MREPKLEMQISRPSRPALVRSEALWVAATAILLCSCASDSGGGAASSGEVGSGEASSSAADFGSGDASSVGEAATGAATDGETGRGESSSGESSSGEPIDPNGTVLCELAASMQPGSWDELPVLDMDSTFLDTGGSNNSILLYNQSMVWDPTTRSAYFFGSDHGGLPLSDPNTSFRFVKYDADTNTWTRLPAPPWLIWQGDEPGRGLYGDGHGYDHLEIDPVSRTIYRRIYWGPTMAYDIDTATWDPTPLTGMEYGCCHGMAFFPERNGLVFNDVGWGSVWLYDTTNDEFSTIGTTGQNSTWAWAEYSSVTETVLIGANSGAEFFTLGADGDPVSLGVLDKPVYDGTGFNGVVTVDPVSGGFLFVTAAADGRQFYSYHVDSNTFTLNPAQPPAEFVTGGLAATPIDTCGVTMFIHTTGAKAGTWLYKHDA